MSVANDLDEAKKWLISKIKAAVAHSRVVSGRAPAGMDYPLVRVIFVPGKPDSVGQSGLRLMSLPSFDVTVVTDGAPTDESEAQVEAIDDALNAVNEEASGGIRISSRRIRPLEYTSPGATAEDFFTYRGAN